MDAIGLGCRLELVVQQVSCGKFPPQYVSLQPQKTCAIRHLEKVIDFLACSFCIRLDHWYSNIRFLTKILGIGHDSICQ